jgi:DNA topoisomerase-1
MHLIIAEKNIAAQRIAQILASPKRPQTSREGGVPTYSWDGTEVVGLKGHVVELDFPSEFGDWRSSTHTPRSLIDAPLVKRVTEKKIVTLIQRLGKKADQVTIATDYDTEGELIGKEAYELIRAVNPRVPIHRARFSAITPEEIQNAFSRPAELDMAIAAAGETRQVVDLVWGASLTRFISLAGRRGGMNILSVGRVQSPTLAMIVDREKEIESFVPEPYWVLRLQSEKDATPFEAEHSHGRFTSELEALAARDRTREPLRVCDVKETEKVERPPPPFDTTAYIVAAARLGLGAAKAMQVAEDLYMNGFISYPRTDNTVYPPSLHLEGILTALQKTEFRQEVSWVRDHRRSTPTRGKKESTDHPPIHPTSAANREELGEERWKVYELVVRRFLATLSPDARWNTLRISLQAHEEPYLASGSRLLEAGWRNVYRYGDVKERILPVFVNGEILPIQDVILDAKETQPPPRFTQSRLIQRMEELGLGTKSTRHEVMSKLLSRRYIQGTPLRPTLVGRAVIDTLEDHVDTITKPEMTRTLETHMQQIKERNRTKEDVISESRGMLQVVFDQLEAHREAIGEEIMERTAEERVLGRCPVCNGTLRVRMLKDTGQFIGCSNYPACTFNINLPGVMWGRAVRMDTICPEHGLHHIRLVRKGARPWDLGCPLCSHINTHAESLRLIPSMTEDLLSHLHAQQIYTIHEVTSRDPEKLSQVLDLSPANAQQLRKEAEEVLALLRRRSDLKKFVRSYLPPRRGRHLSTLLARLHGAGVNDVRALASAENAALKAAGIGEEEADILRREAQFLCGERRFAERGIPAGSRRKYVEGGITEPEDLCRLPIVYLSYRTGLSPDTVSRHASMVCEGQGRAPPSRISRAAMEKGRKELLSIPGIGEATLEKLYLAGIQDAAMLAAADPVRLAAESGLPEPMIRNCILSARSHSKG